MDNESGRSLRFTIPEKNAGERVDSFLASQVSELTRSRIKELIKRGHVTVNASNVKASYGLRYGDRVLLVVPPPEKSHLEPEKVDFTVVHEDEALIVLDKPAGIVVHPAPGHSCGTLVHGLLDHCTDLSGIGGVMRPGIVHRLDKDTSGLLVVAKDNRTHEALARQFKQGGVKKEYVVLVHGRPEGDKGTIDLPIGRHPIKRKTMAVVAGGGKRAVTLWRVLEHFGGMFSLLQIHLKTGRTHQIRVHLSHMGCPVAGDPVYGPGRSWWKRHDTLGADELQRLLGRQMLHARRLGFTHPKNKTFCSFEAPIPEDFSRLTEALKRRVAVDNNP